jgi:hypothetical protein
MATNYDINTVRSAIRNALHGDDDDSNPTIEYPYYFTDSRVEDLCTPNDTINLVFKHVEIFISQIVHDEDDFPAYVDDDFDKVSDICWKLFHFITDLPKYSYTPAQAQNIANFVKHEWLNSRPYTEHIFNLSKNMRIAEYVAAHPDVVLGGDVEMNPGPATMSRFLSPPPRNNCSRGGDTRKHGYRARSDPEHKQNWLEREIKRLEEEFHRTDATDTSRMEVLAEGTMLLVDTFNSTGNLAQIGIDFNLFGIGAVTNSVDRAVDVAQTTAQEVRSDIASAFQSIPNMIERALNSQAGFIPIEIRTILLCILTLIALYVLKRLLCVSYDFFSFVYTLVKAMFTGCASIFSCFDTWVTLPQMTMEAQVGEEEKLDVPAFVTRWIPTVVPMLLSLTVAGALTKVPCRDNSPDAWMRRLDLAPRACKGMGDIYKFIQEWFLKGTAYAKELVYGPDPLDEKNGLPMVTRWMEEVVELSKDLATTCRTRSGCEKVKNLWYRGDRLLKEYRSLMDRETMENVKRMLSLAARMKDTAMNTYGRPKGVRAVPQLVWLVGESQIGKSTMQYFLAAELLAEFGMAKDIEDQMYMRAVEQEYADGYNGQYVWVIDDAFQMKDSPSAPNIEFFEIIRAVGNFPYALHMADISQKANTYFDSKSLICSTNNANLDIQSLTYPDAVFNRFAFAYHVRVKKKYQTVKVMHGHNVITLNKSLAMKDAPIVNGVKMPFNLNVYEFVRFDPCNKNKIDEEQPLSFQEMAAVLRKDLRARDKQSTGLSAMLKTYAARLDAGQSGDGTRENLDDETKPLLDFEELPEAQIDGTDGATNDENEAREALNHGPLTTAPFSVFTLKKLKESWMAIINEPDTPQNAEIKLDAVIVRSELAQLPYADSTFLRDIDWDEHLITTQDVLVRAFVRPKPEITMESTWKKFTDMAEILRQRWVLHTTKVKELWARIAVPVFDTVMGYLAGRVGCAMFTTGAMIGFCYFTKKLREHWKVKHESESDTRAQQPKARTHMKTAARKTFTRGRAAEMAEDVAQQNIIEKLRRNQFYLSITCTEDGEKKIIPYGNAVVVTGSILMMPCHFTTAMLDINKAETVRLIRHDAVEGFEFTIQDFLRDYVCQDEHDLTFVNLKKLIPQRCNIVNLFASHEKSSRLEGRFKATLSGYRRSPKGELDKMLMKGTVRPVEGVIYNLANKDLVGVREAYEYDIDTMKGDCGMLLTVCDPRSAEKIIGMHVAGCSTGKNWASAIWRELIESGLENFDKVAQMEGSFSHLEPCEVPIKGEFLPVGHLPDGPNEIAKSNIIPSSLHGKLSTPTCKPAKLRPFEHNGILRDPLKIGVEKGGQALPMINKEHLRIAIDDVFEEMAYNHRDRKIDMRVLTFEEAVAGAETEEMLHGISRVTSPGYPYTKIKNRGKGKTKWMGREDDYVFDTEDAQQFREDVESLERKARNGERMDVLWVDTLKDERRPIEKVDEGKTRVFSNGPMHFNVLFRKYFQMAITHIQHNRIYNGSGVGINVWSAEWEALYRFLTKFGTDNIFDGDLSGLDVSLAAEILWGVEEILDRLYDDEHSSEREALWMNVVTATRYFRKVVYQCLHNVPSGLPGTTIIDTLALKICFRLIWLMVAPPELRTMAAFREHVRIVIYGDDNVVAVSPIAAEFYNMETVTVGFARLGMKYTDAGKTGELIKLKSIYDVQFLKRKFKFSKYLGRHTCPADLESRLESLNWTRNNNVIDTRVIEVDTIQNVLQEIAAFADKDFFDEWASKILKAAREAELPGLVNEGFFHYHIPKEERF